MFDPEHVRGRSAHRAGKPIETDRPQRWLDGYREAEFEAEIKRLGQYDRIRTLEDGTVVGMRELMFTRAIFFDCDLVGHDKRFCFDNPARADEEFDRLVDIDSEPTGWIARRPEIR